MKKKKLLNNFLLCVVIAMSVCGIAACASKPESVTAEQIIEANDRQKVIEEYGNLHVTLTADEVMYGSNLKTICFTSNEYGLIMDYEDAESEDKYNHCTCINGVRYVACKDGDEEQYYASIFTGDYTAFISEIRNINTQANVGTPEIKDGKVVLVTTETYDYTDFSLTYENTYYCNRETLLIEKVISHATSDGEEIATDEYTYVYGSEHTPPLKAYSLHKNATDKANFVVVSNAGTSSEKRTEYTIAGTSDLRVENLGETQYALYSDAVHSEEVEQIAPYVTGGETPVFYLAESTAPTLKQLTEANDRQKVIEEYGNLHVTETTTYESGAVYTANALFYANDYGLVMDYLDEASDGSKYNSTTMINGMMFVFNNGVNNKLYIADLYADSEYNAKISTIYNLVKSDVIQAPEVKDGKIVVETEFEYPLFNYSEKKTFYFNAETLLIERATTQYTITTSDAIGTTTNEVTYEYGCSNYSPALTAYNAHKNAENKSGFIVVRNAGTADEKRTEYTISGQSALVVYDGEEKEYALYADADCTIEVENYKDYLTDGEAPVFYLAEKTAVPTLN